MLGLSDEIMNDVIDLTVDYTFSRYPDVSELVPYEEYDEEIAQEKVDKAKRIFERLKRRYKKLEEKNNREIADKENDNDE